MFPLEARKAAEDMAVAVIVINNYPPFSAQRKGNLSAKFVSEFTKK
jgi:hypothetical protein